MTHPCFFENPGRVQVVAWNLALEGTAQSLRQFTGQADEVASVQPRRKAR